MENPVSRFAVPVARYAAIACGYGILALSAAICLEVVGRKFFGFSLQGVDDIGGYALAITAAVGASYTMAMRGHTRIDVFLVRMSVNAQAWLNAVAMVTLACFAIYAFARGIDVLAESIEFRSVATNPLQTPLWQPQGTWLFGLGLFAVFAALYAAHALWLLAKDRRRLNRLYGPTTAKDEVDAELETRRNLEGAA
ncbi:MAG: TRAP transporter small permease [Proteobacteria bacterium]|nr:TRAP transporter small permease [Pseudomonadota bacterium]